MKQKITYSQWKSILLRVAKNRGYVPSIIQADFDPTWKPLYDKGYSPTFAWDVV